MNFKANFKGIFNIEKKFNVNLLPSELTIDDKLSIFWTSMLRLVGLFLYILLISVAIVSNINDVVVYLMCICIVIYIILDISSVVIISDEMKKKNFRYLVINKDNEFYKLDKYFYDITEKLVLQYTIEEKTITVKGIDDVIEGKKIVTEFMNSTDNITFIQTRNSSDKYYNKYISVIPFLQDILLVCLILFMTAFPSDIFAIVCFILSFVLIVISTYRLSSKVNVNEKKENFEKLKTVIGQNFNDSSEENSNN
ncbi:hypothetical protein [Staphylococcus epidermidis]|uniref:hypothetical protein n=1 Tax=Staphylococcus epidermidis TaxID=1282 RepID=UPI0002992902|nr:hypothetical protein [Staphylococcus epidermidis]EKS40468.1 hypothetical protein HMPREF9281_00005 [Staphylococcus epidermidis BVS058A4]